MIPCNSKCWNQSNIRGLTSCTYYLNIDSVVGRHREHRRRRSFSITVLPLSRRRGSSSICGLISVKLRGYLNFDHMWLRVDGIYLTVCDLIVGAQISFDQYVDLKWAVRI